MFCSKPVKDDPHVIEVVILIRGESDDIVQVDQAVGEVLAHQGNFASTFGRFAGTLHNPNGMAFALKETQ